MKAQYIINAIVAMRSVEALNYSTSPEVFGRTMAELQIARIDLAIYSGLNDVQVAIEKDA